MEKNIILINKYQCYRMALEILIFTSLIIQRFIYQSMKTIKLTFLLWISLLYLFMICSTAFKMAQKNIQTSQSSLAELYKLRKERIISKWQQEQRASKQTKQIRSTNIKRLQKVFNNGNKTIPETKLNGNMLIIGRYAIFPQNTVDVPTLKKVNLDSMAIETIKYPQLKDWSDYLSITISDLQNGDLAYGVGVYILILDRSTLKLKQTLEFLRFRQVIKFDVFVDPKTSESKMIVESGSPSLGVSRLYELKKKSGSTQYGLNFLTFAPAGQQRVLLNLKLTGLNKGTSIYDYQLNNWQNFDEIIDESYDSKYMLKSRDKIALSYDETMLVVRNNLNYYEIYNVAQNYQLTLKKSLIISYNQNRKAEFTTDDKFLFVLMSNPRKIHNIAKVIVSEGEFVLVTDTDGISDNHVDFNLFASETDRMIVLALKGTTYVLQLRTISNLTILNELPLKFNFTVLNYKLVGSRDWGLTFALATQFANDYREQLNSNLYQYSVIGDKIVASSLNGKINIDSTKACFKYFVSFSGDKGVKIYHFQNFTLQALIQTGNYDDVSIEKHFMSMGEQNFCLYDLTKSLECQGVYYKGDEQMQSKITFMFPKRKLLIDITTGQYLYGSIMRIVYNISEPQVKNIVQMENRTFSIDAQTHYVPYVGSTCNKVFYISYGWNASVTQLLQWNQNPRLIEYDECSKNLRTFPIQFDDVWSSKIFLSSDNKYMIIIMQYFYQSSPDRFLIEIRAIDKLENILIHKEFGLGQFYDYYSISNFRADLLNRSQLVIKANNFIFSANIESNDQTQNHLRQQI